MATTRMASEFESDQQDTVDRSRKWLVNFNTGNLEMLTGLVTLVM